MKESLNKEAEGCLFANAKTCVEITTDVSVKFGEFLCTYPDKNRNIYGEILHAKSKYDDAGTTKNLFEEFINNHYGK